MWKALTADSILPYALLGMTAVTGLVDAVSFLSLGHVFTANMTGNIVLLAFASTGVPQVSLAGSITALLGFLAGAAVGGRIMAGASAVVQLRAASSVFALEIVFLVGATLAALGYSVVSSPHFLRLYAMIAFTAIAMGMRNAAVRKLSRSRLDNNRADVDHYGHCRGFVPGARNQSPFAAANCSGGGDVCWCSVRLDNPKTLRLHGSRFFRRTVVTLQPRVADIVAVALRKKRRKGLEVVS